MSENSSNKKSWLDEEIDGLPWEIKRNMLNYHKYEGVNNFKFNFSKKEGIAWTCKTMELEFA